MELTTSISSKLGWYVYGYVNPIDGKIFYVGKGKGRRVLSHLSNRKLGKMASMLKTIRKAGFKPRLEILAHGISNASEALTVEAAVIDSLGLQALTNRMRGWRAVRYERVPLSELIAYYEKRKVSIKEPAILIRINELYRPDMSPCELYDATRGVWKVGDKNRNKVELAFGVYEGMIREVYEVTCWLKAGSSFMSRKPDGLRRTGRWEFVGRIAPTIIRKRYLGRFVGHHFKQGARNPIAYLNV